MKRIRVNGSEGPWTPPEFSFPCAECGAETEPQGSDRICTNYGNCKLADDDITQDSEQIGVEYY